MDCNRYRFSMRNSKRKFCEFLKKRRTKDEFVKIHLKIRLRSWGKTWRWRLESHWSSHALLGDVGNIETTTTATTTIKSVPYPCRFSFLAHVYQDLSENRFLYTYTCFKSMSRLKTEWKSRLDRRRPCGSVVRPVRRPFFWFPLWNSTIGIFLYHPWRFQSTLFLFDSTAIDRIGILIIGGIQKGELFKRVSFIYFNNWMYHTKTNFDRVSGWKSISTPSLWWNFHNLQRPTSFAWYFANLFLLRNIFFFIDSKF